MSAELNWEELRREARSLENEIDSKLISFSKVGATTTVSILNETDNDKVPLLSHSNKVSDSLSDEISELLSRLFQINEKLNEFAMLNQTGLTREMQHTLQRHREIFQDYNQEFKKTSTNLRSRKEREELLKGIDHDIDSSKTSLNRRMDFYLKEHNHLKTSERLVDEQIAIAVETKENLSNQRMTFKKMQSRMNDLTSRFPALNNLISKINSKKRNDSIVIGIVVGICIFLLLFYSFH